MKVPVYKIICIDIPEDANKYREVVEYVPNKPLWDCRYITKTRSGDKVVAYIRISQAEVAMRINKARKYYPNCIHKKRI